MSYREISMLEIKKVLLRKEPGASGRRIAREMGIDRKTIGRYLAAIEDAGIGDATEVVEQVLAGIARVVQKRKPVERSEAWQALLVHRSRIEAWLTQMPPLVLTRVHELLARHGVEVGYTTLRRLVERELGWRKRSPTVLLAGPPLGEKAQIDFGLMGLVTDQIGRHPMANFLSVSMY